MLRLDSEYQKTAYLAAIAEARQSGATQLGDDDPTIIHPQEIVREYVGDEGVWFLRAQNVRPLLVDTTNRVLISAEDAGKLPRNRIEKGDVLVTRTGANRGQCAYFDREEVAIASSHTFIIRPKTIDPEYLAVFLNTRNGIAQIDRGVYGAAQPEIAPYYLKNIWVPNASAKLMSTVKQCFLKSKQAATLAETAIGQAEETLLEALGLVDWTPPEPLSYSARASDAFAAGRLDAQYFRPLFAEVEQRLLATGGAVELGAILDINSRGRQPVYSDEGLPVVNSKHVRTNRVVLDDDNRRAVGAGSPVVIEKGDVLVNGTGVGTIGRAAAFLHEQSALPDNHVTVLRTSRVDPIYLAVFLNSLLGQLQIERHIKGSSGQIELYPNDIAKIVFWDAPDQVQTDVRDAVLSAFREERRAQDLLDAAKRAVEIAIEDGEPAALDFLDSLEEAS
uniref:hypothetical protein n=1 Tax=Stappia sp. TaxID=1870903 RepID=UPI003BACEAEE